MSQPVHYLHQPHPGDSGAGPLAYRRTAPKASRHRAAPDVLFCGGFHSNMDGGKASFLDTQCKAAGMGYTRFDYRGHGLSSGRFQDGTIGDWYADARLIFDSVTKGPQIVVGSSMGAWMALLLARDRTPRIAGLILIAPAPDFPRRLMQPSLPPEAAQALETQGVWHRPSEFEDDAYPITQRLIDESADHEILDGPPPGINGPIHILHGTADEVVPLSHATRLVGWLGTDRTSLDIVDGGGHRLSDPAHLNRLWNAVQAQTPHVP